MILGKIRATTGSLPRSSVADTNLRVGHGNRSSQGMTSVALAVPSSTIWTFRATSGASAPLLLMSTRSTSHPFRASPLAKVIIVRSAPPSGRDNRRIASLGRLCCGRLILFGSTGSMDGSWPPFQPTFFGYTVHSREILDDGRYRRPAHPECCRAQLIIRVVL